MSIHELSFRSWLPWMSKYWTLATCDETNALCGVPAQTFCVFICLVDLSEKLVHSPGLDAFTFLSQHLKQEEATIRKEFISQSQKTKEELSDVLKYQKFSNHSYNFFSFQKKIYDMFCCLFLSDTTKPSILSKWKRQNSVLEHEGLYENTIAFKMVLAFKTMAIQLGRFMDIDYQKSPSHVSSMSSPSPDAPSSYSECDPVGSEYKMRKERNYNPLEKYLINNIKNNRKLTSSNTKSQSSKKNKKGILKSDLEDPIFLSNSEYDNPHHHFGEESLSLHFATFSQFSEVLLALSVITDKNIEKLIPSYPKKYNSPNLKTSPDSDGIHTTKITGSYDSIFSKHIDDIENDMFSSIPKSVVYDACLFLLKTHLIPCLFYYLWIIKTLSKNCDRVTTHQLGPLDSSFRLVTESSFKGNANLFKSCNDEEAQELLDTLWRLTLKLGKRFNLFGVEDYITDSDKFYKSVLAVTKISDFGESFVDDTWYASLGIKRVVSKSQKNGKKITTFHKEVPIIAYDVSKICKIVSLLSVKGNTLLDSTEFRIFMTIFWNILETITNSNDLITYLHQLKHLTATKGLTPVVGTREDLDMPQELRTAMGLFPKYFAVETVLIEGKEVDNEDGQFNETECVVVSSSFLKDTESVISYFVELVCVVDFLSSTYICKTPKLPSDDFCEKWISFCQNVCSDDNYSDFIQSKFTDIFWNRAQFYGECDNYNTATKIVQANPITSIIIKNRYRHHEVCDKVTKFLPKEILDFAIEQITYCQNVEQDLRFLFGHCWDIHRIAILKDPPSQFMQDVVHKMKKLSVSKVKKENGDAEEEDEEEEIEDQVVKSSRSYEKEKQELKELLAVLEIEKRKSAESEFPSHVYKDYIVSQNQNSMLGKNVSTGGDNFAPSSLLDRALESKENYKNAMQLITNSNIFTKTRLVGEGNSKMDTMYLVTKTQRLPIGLIEFNIIQETVLYIIAFKNNKMLKETSTEYNVLKNQDDIENMNDLVRMDPNIGLSYPTYDSRSSYNDEYFSIYDTIFSSPDMVLASNKKNHKTENEEVLMTTTVDDIEEEEEEGDEMNILSKKQNNIREYWSEKQKYRTAIEGDDYEDADLSDEEDLTRMNNANMSVGEELSKSYGLPMEDEEFGMGGETYEKVYRELENKKRRFSGIAKDQFKDLRDIKQKRNLAKEWPDIMNYDLLQQRVPDEIQNLETPLTIFECSFDVKRHALFRRSTRDKPCFFMYFNRYFLCDGRCLYSSHFCNRLPVISKNPKRCKLDEKNNKKHKKREQHDYAESDEEYNYFVREDLSSDSEEYKMFSTNTTFPFTTPWDFACILGTLIHLFEKNTELFVETYYKLQKSTKEQMIDIIENLQDGSGRSVLNRLEKWQDNNKNIQADLVKSLDANYATFPRIILDGTLDYSRVFDPSNEDFPMKKVQKLSE